MKKGLFLFLIVLNVHVYGQNINERSKKLSEGLGKEFSLSKPQVDTIFLLNLKTAALLDSVIMKSSQPDKEGRIPLETMDIESEKEVERIENQWKKEIKKIIGRAKIRAFKREEQRENKKEESSQVRGMAYEEMFEITYSDLGFLNLYPY